MSPISHSRFIFADDSRQLVTNHFLHFLALERADPKKFQVLQIIASLLGWTDGKAELCTPKTESID